MAGRYVLAIEHNWHLRKVIKANLEAVGFEVREAVSLQHALQRLDEERPDLILLGLDLPGEESLEVLRTASRKFATRPVPVVLISADPPDRRFLRRPEVMGHLIKPFGVPSLLAHVRGLLCSPPANC